MLFLYWISRCIPGLSIIVLLLLIACSFPAAVPFPQWRALFSQPAAVGGSPSSDNPGVLTVWQRVFITYFIFIHLNAFSFTVRLSVSLINVTRGTKRALMSQLWDTRRHLQLGQQQEQLVNKAEEDEECSGPGSILKYPSATAFGASSTAKRGEIVHAIILANYAEDIDTLKSTLDVLASHPRAHTQYEVYLAMEQKEVGAAEKAAKLISLFEGAFLLIRPTFHPAGLPGEIAGKGSNVAFAARHIVEVHRADLTRGSCNVVITVMDADTHLLKDYFTEIRRLHYAHITEADRTLYCCPIIFDRNSHRTPILVRCADLIWCFAGISTMYPGALISIPTSVYSLSLSLAEKVGGWDTDSTTIGEDMHMLLKCYFETAGNVVTKIIYIPASQCNISSEVGVGWRRSLDTCISRYRQALRHMWGALDTGFAARRSVSYFSLSSRCLFLRPRHLILLHFLWEAHIFPCHLTLLIIFSAIYDFCVPRHLMNADLAWAIWFTGLLRTLAFIWMNVCLALYERWHELFLSSRRQDMIAADLPDTGFSPRVWWKPKFLLERACFPISGIIYGAVPILHAVFAHFWTDQLVYRVSKKPQFTRAAATAV